MTISLRKRQEQVEGFSLLEMLIVLAIIALAVGLSLPALMHRSTPSASQFADAVVATLHRARMDAVSKGSQVSVIVDVVEKTVRYHDDVLSIPQDVTASLLVGQELATGTTSGKILFMPDGASSGAQLTLQEAGLKPVTVRVPWLTGIPSKAISR